MGIKGRRTLVIAALLLASETAAIRAQERPPIDVEPLPARDFFSSPTDPDPSGLPRPVPVPLPRTVAPAVVLGRPLRLADALGLSLRNVETVQANLTVRAATIARFDALKAFVPLVNMPMFAVGLSRLTGTPANGQTIIFPDVTGGTPFVGQPGLDHASINRFNLFLPLDPSGHVTALPIAEEGIRAKELMEQFVRRSQAVLAAQRYFEAKQIQYGLRVSTAGVNLAEGYVGLFERKLREKQAHDVEVSQARVDLGRARVLLANLEKDARITQRRLGVVVHQCRLLVPPEAGPVPITPECAFAFDLAYPDTVEIGLVPDFPSTREQAIERAKRQRFEVRLMVVGLRIARLQAKRDKLRLFGLGQLPITTAFKNTTPGNGGIALGMLFGTVYDLPVTNVGLWAQLRQARLDEILSQISLERALLEASEDAGTSWDRWQQAAVEWDQKEAEYRLQIEYLDRQTRLYREKQVIRLDVAGADINLLRADANRWTAWYNLQLARLDILRATELLLDYIEKAGITDLPHIDDVPPESAPRRGIFHGIARQGRSATPIPTGG
ncbi:MAG: hypothetical protein P4L84_37685 [Isosphaeraceae bacterium]|nr:hypothetical protein [Isosphaeraceae bacterium]